MNCVKMLLMIFVMGVGITAMAAGPPAGSPSGERSANPFQDRLDNFSVKDKSDPPAKHGVEFVGSSMLEGWSDVTAQMAPFLAFNRAIGGSKTADILSHLDQLVLQYEPRVVVLYSGINDVSEGISSETAAENIQKIIEGILSGLPGTRVIYIAILNTSNRSDSSGPIKDANSRVRTFAEKNPRVTYLDISGALVDGEGNTRSKFLTDDHSHYNTAAYEAMARVVKPVLEDVWLQ